MKKSLTFLLLFFGLIISSSNVYGQNLLTNSSFENGTLGADTAPTGWTSSQADYNDPSAAPNDPRGNTDQWIGFDGIAGNNDSQDGGRAVGGDRNNNLYHPVTAAVGDTYTIYFEQANPGLDVGGAGTTLQDGDGYWRIRLNGGSFVSGPVISVSSGTMVWSKATVTVTAGSTTEGLRIQARENTDGDPIYIQIDNVILVPECTEDLGDMAANDIYGDCIIVCECYPTSTGEANDLPGVLNTNPSSCSITPGEPTAVIEIPTFDCAVATAVSFDTPILPDNPRILYHYWGNCSPLSPSMPIGISPKSNGYIQQMFCETDAFGLPAFPGGLSGENGIITFLPEKSEDVGSNGLAEVGSTCDGGGTGTDEKESELIQLDFWMAIPDIQSQVGFRFSTNNREDAGSFFVGADLNNMCEVAYFTDGQNHDALTDQLTGTFNIDGQLTGTCGLSWVRVRVYINDIADQFEVNPQINAGTGWVSIDQLLIEPALTADDNIAPTVATTTVNGYLVDGMFVYDDGGTWDPYGCNPMVTEIDEGSCRPLPIELISFDAALNDQQVTLNWKTATEVNNLGFEIQESSNGIDWKHLGWVEGNGSTSEINTYDFLDRDLFSGDNYYRLKQLDYDGQFEYSNIATVRNEASASGIVVEVSPNPSPGDVKVTVHNPKMEKMSIQLFDSAGLLIWQSGTLANLNTWNKKFSLTQKEMYFISVQVGKETFAKKILIVDKF